MKAHELKTWPKFFAEVATGAKPFEVRQHDRDFQAGDVLILREWDPETSSYAPGRVARRVTYLLPGGTGPQAFGVMDGYVVMGLAPIRLSQVATNALKDPTYCPYCMRCSGAVRMSKVEHLYWRHHCGAEHDERDSVAAHQLAYPEPS